MSGFVDEPDVEPATTAENEVTISQLVRTRQKFRLNMEVPFFCMFFAVSLSGAVISNMLLDRACRLSLGYNETECRSLQQPGAHDSDLENKVQGVTTLVLMGQGTLEGVVPAVVSFSLGPWSDKHGRKPLCTWPLFGYALTAILVAAYSLVENLSVYWFIATSLPFSLGGGGSALFTGAFCHMSDVTHEGNRSFRLAMLESSLLAGSVLGSLASRYAQAALGTPTLLLLTACIAVLAYVYTVISLRESVSNAQPGGIASIFDKSLVRDMLSTCFKPRPNYDRAALFLLIACNGLTIFVLYGLFNIDYLYVREKLSWQLGDYCVYSAVNTSVMVVGMVIGVGLLQKRCRMGDAVLAIVSFVSCVAEAVCKSLATVSTSWLMYFGSGISALRGLSSPLIRSQVSKRVPARDVAKFFALMAALDAILPVFSPMLYSTLYKFTLQTMPQAVYLLSVGFYSICLVMICLAHHFMEKYPMQTYSPLES